ncbi:hypothetical protein PHLGIDRAFT_117257 [Phlebiopsis gigantea 11061_1 CR5-6]|uniref:Heterokaryon incompatibility domain-containing protein n=1 Tax=Phlebiopsis gigantea (strain 11061_1 CR5-6) TaxID=745531 RepID=A0A0C3SBZ4_PHLG1|nr:hypothetical protein PHLGIDRAFT_117257 [Phlebiopsis gigantea 11061_1 CR5-6]
MPIHGAPVRHGRLGVLAGLLQVERREAAAHPSEPAPGQGTDRPEHWDPKHRRYTLAHLSLTCPDAPWNIPPGGLTAIPRFVGDRLCEQSYASPQVKAAERRTVAWGVLAMATRSVVPDEFLFTSSGQGNVFTLRCPSPTSVPFQRVHQGPMAIPDELADRPCTDMGLQDMLHQLNSILHTRYTLDEHPGLATCLQYVAAQCCDFGELYGRIRPWWLYDFTNLPEELDSLKTGDEELRRNAVHGDRIVNPDVPPRRVWDLYSNRVIPFHALCPVYPFRFDMRSSPPPTRVNIPRNVWAISHGWLNEDERQLVRTTINGKQWPVPIPRETTLAHVRIELLNLGAEWVWLDVLCLRQRGHDRDEQLRKEEWQLDVPIIGHVYQHDPSQTCVTYFNGLGIPFDGTPARVWSNERHWFRRAWTLQETCIGWLPGGMTGAEIGDSPAVFGVLEVKLRGLHRGELFRMVNDICARCSSTPIDKIAGLGYLLQCPTLPVYNEDTTAERAWSLLVRHLHPRVRIELLSVFPEPGPYRWYPSWEQLAQKSFTRPVTGTMGAPYIRQEECLKYNPDSDTYFHSVHHAVVDSRIVSNQTAFDSGEAAYEISHQSFEHKPWYISLQPGHRPLDQDVLYTCVGIGDLSFWIVARKVGTRQLEDESATILEKIGVFCVEDYTTREELDHWTRVEGARMFVWL